MVQADYLFLMTDVDCLYDKNPRTNIDAEPIEVVEDISLLEADVSTIGSTIGTGGMSTKIVAARLATSAGVTTVITRSSKPGNIINIIRHGQAVRQAQLNPSSSLSTSIDDLSLSHSTSTLDRLQTPPLHTCFISDPQPIRDRSFWLLHGLAPHGSIFIDEGAHRALNSKAGLLPAGILGVEGPFAQQEAVRIIVCPRSPNPVLTSSSVSALSTSGIEIGRALVNYSSAEIMRIKGLQSSEIESVLGYAESDYVALRQNVSLIKREKTSRPGTPGPAT